MKAFFKILKTAVTILISSAVLFSCGAPELETQNDFPFVVTVMPVPSEIAFGDTAEIRLTIKRSGNYIGAKYFIRYFQLDGHGILKYYDLAPYLPNDLYPLPDGQFRLYYTSLSKVSQSFDIWISDNFGNEKQLTFKFNSSD